MRPSNFLAARRAERVSGGDTHESYIIKDETHRYFVKTRRYDDTQQLSHEAEGLTAIANTQTICTPQVICHGITANESPNMEYLVLSHIRFVEPAVSDYFTLGQQLAALHSVNAYTSYGWPHDNYIGASVQTNGTHGIVGRLFCRETHWQYVRALGIEWPMDKTKRRY